MDDQQSRKLLWPVHQGGPNAAKDGPVPVVPPQGTREELSTLPFGRRGRWQTDLRPNSSPAHQSAPAVKPPTHADFPTERAQILGAGSARPELGLRT